jgi:hypothetical protein
LIGFAIRPFSQLASNTVTDVGEARLEVKKFMTKVDKTETKYAYKNK